MQIEDIRVRGLNLKLMVPFRIALGTITDVENLIVEVETDTGLLGLGEAAAVPFVSGETQAGIEAALIKYIKPVLLGEDPRCLERIHRRMDMVIRGNGGAKAAVDFAVHDILGKEYGVPLYRFLGGTADSYESDMTVGIDAPEAMARRAREITEAGYTVVKTKVGLDVKKDIERVRMIRQAVGEGIRLRLDANQGWNVKEAVYAINRLAEYDVELVEQPVPYYDIDGLAFIRRQVEVPIMADESVFSPEDALRLIKAEAVDYINIKLMKCGGLYKAQIIANMAAAAGIKCMLGCMLESRVGVTAAAHLAAASSNIVSADLDAPLFLASDPVLGGVSPQPGVIRLGEKPGLGIERVKI